MIFALVGILSAISKSYDGQFYNFFAAVSRGERSPFGMLLRITGYTTLVYFFIFASSFHFSVFIAGYGGIAVGSYFFFRCGFASAAADGLWGILYLLLFLTPVFLLNMVSVILCMIKVYDFRGYAVDRKCFINLACNSKRLLKEMLQYYYFSMIVTHVVWLFWYLILLLIFPAA
jgi:hypothetical protein